MATGGVLGNGTKIGFSASGTSPITYTRVTQVMNIDEFPQLIAADIETTVMGTSNVKTNMPGLVDPPNFGFTLLLDMDEVTSPTHETLRSAQVSGADLYWRLEIPTNRAQSKYRGLTFVGYVKEFSPSMPIDDKQTVKVTVRYSGSYAWDGGAGASLLS